MPKNDDFINLARSVAELVAAVKPADVAELSAARLGDKTVEHPCRPSWSARSAKHEHPSLRFVEAKGRCRAMFTQARRSVCWSIWSAGTRRSPGPRDAHCRQQAEIARRQRRIERPARYRAPYRHREGARSGKPEAMLEKIAEGTVQKFLKDVTLLGQVFVKAEDGKQTVKPC